MSLSITLSSTRMSRRRSCDREGRTGSGSPMYYINMWAMIWPTDYPEAADESRWMINSFKRAAGSGGTLK